MISIDQTHLPARKAAPKPASPSPFTRPLSCCWRVTWPSSAARMVVVRPHEDDVGTAGAMKALAPASRHAVRRAMGFIRSRLLCRCACVIWLGERVIVLTP